MCLKGFGSSDPFYVLRLVDMLVPSLHIESLPTVLTVSYTLFSVGDISTVLMLYN